jgi:hypothetical protein
VDSATIMGYRSGIDEAESWQYGVDATGISRRALSDVKPSGTGSAAANQQRWGLARCG